MTSYIEQKMIEEGYTHSLWIDGYRHFVKSRRDAFEKANHPDWLTYPACLKAKPVDLTGMSDEEAQTAVMQWWSKHAPHTTIRVEELAQ